MPYPFAAASPTVCICGIRLTGVEIGSSITGETRKPLRFGPFFAAWLALQRSVLVHALQPAGNDRRVGPAALLLGRGVRSMRKGSIAGSPVERVCRRFCNTGVFDAPTLGHLMRTADAQALTVGAARRFPGRAAAGLTVALPETA